VCNRRSLESMHGTKAVPTLYGFNILQVLSALKSKGNLYASIRPLHLALHCAAGTCTASAPLLKA